MSDLCLPEPDNNHLGALFLADLFFFCSFAFSHPLYFSYFIYFSHYIIKILSFLSPLFITTSLLFFSLLTPQHSKFSSIFSASKHCFFPSLYHMITEKLLERVDDDDEEEDDFKSFEEFEVYKIVFDTSSFDIIQESSKDEKVISEVPLDSFFKKLDDFDKIPCKIEEKKCISVSRTSNNVIFSDNTAQKLATDESDLGEFDSSRKEKEWKRTLACKLFEDQNNLDEDEVMDSLWEAYEVNSSKSNTRNTDKKLNKIKSRSGEFDYDHEEDDDDHDDSEVNSSKSKPKNTKKKLNKIKSNSEEFDYDHEEEDDDSDDEYRHVQLCCLQAFKFSSSKTNLGIGKPNLVKFSKVLKGIRWLHHATKNSKKR